MFSEEVSCSMVTPENTMVTISYEFVAYHDMDFEMNDGEVYELELNTNQQLDGQTNIIF